MLNIYVPSNSTTLNSCINAKGSGNSYYILGEPVNWTNDTANNRYYNTTYNTYIYPVANVEEVRYNELKIFSYTTNNTSFNRPLDFNIANAGYYEYTTKSENDSGNTRYTFYVNRPDQQLTKIRMNLRNDVLAVHYMADSVVNMSNAFEKCYYLQSNPLCASSTTNMYAAYFNCYRITGEPVCGPNVVNMARTYEYCYNLTGSPACGDKVENMETAYICCYNLTGSPVCGDKVENMGWTYAYCNGLTGQPVCGPNVTNMYCTYNNCQNLTGRPVCGNKVTEMIYTYDNCVNLTGGPIVGPNVTRLSGTFQSCPKLQGNGYFFSSNITNVSNSFKNRGGSANRLNLYVPANSQTLRTCVQNYYNNSFFGYKHDWTNDFATNGYYYSDYYNIYIYPVANVENVYRENEL
jgi:YHS domain-containing protein